MSSECVLDTGGKHQPVCVCVCVYKHSRGRKAESSARCSGHLPEGSSADEGEASVTSSSNHTAELNSERGWGLLIHTTITY